MLTRTQTFIDAHADLLPSEADVAFYGRHGYWISGVILAPEVVDAAARSMQRLYAGDTDRLLPDGSPLKGWTPEHGDVLGKNDHASLVVDELAALVRQPIIAACAARLSGAQEIRLWHDQLLYKPPEPADGEAPAVNVGWHTDRQYWLTASSLERCSWVPFHSVGELEGSVSFVDGSHLWDDDVTLDFFDPDLSTLDRVREHNEVEVVIAQVPRGAVSFHHCRTIHGSGPNRSPSARRSIAIHLQPGDNHYVHHTLPDGRPARHGNDTLVRRTTDGTPTTPTRPSAHGFGRRRRMPAATDPTRTRPVVFGLVAVGALVAGLFAAFVLSGGEEPGPSEAARVSMAAAARCWPDRMRRPGRRRPQSVGSPPGCGAWSSIGRTVCPGSCYGVGELPDFAR